ncbi:Transmembrane protein [Parasponia andersonii]|uniref:Transmembrane protein n=1 Tax=Parasponia andersonii TaxID=3476 RepID=A0A2P5ALR6_PARAD|nr:Transmembrane protein [Parasponia andersonii]
MFDSGDDLTVASFRIPWLVWVQVLVMFLLILLLYCFFTLDPTDNIAAIATSSSSHFVSNDTHITNKQNTATTVITNRLQNTQVGESQSIKGELAPGTSRRVVRRGEDNSAREDFSAGTHLDFHPCHYFRLARTAFLKCLGLDLDLDSTSENSSASRRRKRKDQ